MSRLSASHIIAEDRRPPDAQAHEEVSAHLNRPALVNACTEIEDYLVAERLVTLQADLVTLRAEVRFYRGVYEGQGRINRERIPILEAERDKALKDSEEWMGLYSIAIRLIDDFRDDVREMRTDLARSEDLVEFLKAAVQQYASHIWNDIKNIVDAR